MLGPAWPRAAAAAAAAAARARAPAGAFVASGRWSVTVAGSCTRPPRRTGGGTGGPHRTVAKRDVADAEFVSRLHEKALPDLSVTLGEEGACPGRGVALQSHPPPGCTLGLRAAGARWFRRGTRRMSLCSTVTLR